MKSILPIWIVRVVSFMRGGAMRLCIVLRWACLRMRVRFIGEFSLGYNALQKMWCERS